jgi:hypothetical protein
MREYKYQTRNCGFLRASRYIEAKHQNSCFIMRAVYTIIFVKKQNRHYCIKICFKQWFFKNICVKTNVDTIVSILFFKNIVL